MNIETDVPNNKFMLIWTAIELLKEKLGSKYNQGLLDECLQKFILTPVIRDHIVYMYEGDIQLCIRLMELNHNIPKQELNQYGYNGSFLINKIKISATTYLVYAESDRKKPVPAYVRNLLYRINEDNGEECDLCQLELLGIMVVTREKKIRDYVESAIFRKHQIENIKHSNFANSSSYMGSKKKIVGYLMEAMFPHINDGSVFLDIMCGSGAVSNALSQIGNVYASDAQEFCQLLAKIQGHGFSVAQAEVLLRNIYEDYSLNLRELQNGCKLELAEEDKIFHMDIENREMVYDSYQSFIERFNLYSSTDINTEKITNIVNIRKENNTQFPYCLFTYYFTNVYFGLAQNIQLDSIRYAIDQIEDRNQRQWALGTLIVVVSSISTSHAGHFAQPKRIDINSFDSIMEQRQKSAWLEFSVRLLSLAEESSKYPYEVKIQKGPWENALKEVTKRVGKDLVVYLDAPYKREEYSRYYHVLETMAKYDYPSSEYKGRVRSKEKGERFSTEFFTKTIWKVEENFVNLICTILEYKAICVWSYSDNGDASILEVVNQIMDKVECQVYISGTPYQHQSQRKKEKENRTRLNVIEYCLVFVKNDR